MLWGIERASFRHTIDLRLVYPSLIARQLEEDSTDVGLVPVAAIPKIPGARIISEYGIAADGPVASVSLFSQVPINEIQHVYLDYQSRTSVRLAEELLHRHWKQEVSFLPAPDDYISRIEGTTAGVIIGDRALRYTPEFPFVYDLAEHWKKFTGLPFIFAAWVANKDLPEEFLQQFNAANATGLAHLDEIIDANQIPYYDIETYYRQNIKFRFTTEMKHGLRLFHQLLADRDNDITLRSNRVANSKP